MSGAGRSGRAPVSGGVNPGMISSVGNSSCLSLGASSLVTDANSGFSCGPQLQRSTSINNESYMRVPASPLSFSSNISGSSVMDGSSVVQQSSYQEQVKQGASSATSSVMPQESGNSMNAQKRPRNSMRQEDMLQQQVMQQFLQSQEPMLQRGYENLQLQDMLQQPRLAQRQQQQKLLMQAFPQQQVPLILKQQQHPRNHIQPQAVQQLTPAKRSIDNGLCSRRLMQYLYHQRHRPSDNSILYWRKFVMEYFAPGAKKSWCLSMYDKIGNPAVGVFPRSARETWQCDMCGLKSGQGFEATFEVLPRLFQVEFDSGSVLDENMFLDLPLEYQLSSGIMVLEYAKVVQESIYEHLRVVREGKLRIQFTPELKICSWKFCAHKHEEFLSRRMLAPQVNQLLQVVHKYQTAVSENGSNGVPDQVMQASCNMFVAAGRQLARNLDLQSLNDLGFSKRYVRCLQISEVVSSMKDLIEFEKEHKFGAIESLKSFVRQASAKRQKQSTHEPEFATSAQPQPLPADQNMGSKILDVHPGLSRQAYNDIPCSQILNVNQQNTLALNNYHNILRGSTNPNQSFLRQEISNNLNAAKMTETLRGNPATMFRCHPSVDNSSVQQQHPQLSDTFLQQNNLHPSQMNQHLQQHMIQQMLQEMMKNRGVSQHSLSNSNESGNLAAVGGSEGSSINARNVGNIFPNNTMRAVQLRSNSFNSSTSYPMVSGSSLKSIADLPEEMGLPELDHIAQDFADSGVFSGDYSDGGYEWKM